MITELSQGANNAGIYTKKGVDDELKKKADTAALTNKADKNYVDTELGKKANSADLAAKAADVYTKKNVDDELAKKADTAALTNKADKNYVDTELGKKAGAADLANKANTADVYTKTAADTAFVKATELKTKAAAKDVVDAIFDAKDGNNKISETKIGATFAKKTDLNDKVNVLGDNATEAGVNAMLGKLTGDNVVVKINASNLTDAENQKAFAEAILSAKNCNKSILADKLEGFLAENAKVYSNNTKTAKELLVPSAAEIAAKVVNEPNFTVNVTDTKIKEVVKETVSQPSFELPTSDDVALNWTW
ncbi:MAG: hypothetical protein O7167_01375 [Wolbachia endosymbiont of Andrena nigroaenea]|nr:hypothetical protein [Wolbachia endosymbiont of Andrena nigroaenea]